KFVMVAAALLTCACQPSNSKIPMNYKGYYRGNLSKGSAFGLEVGTRSDAVEKVLFKRGLPYMSEVKCEQLLAKLIDCRSSNYSKIDMYHLDQPVRHGLVYIIQRKDRVVRIVWQAHPIPPIDF